MMALAVLAAGPAASQEADGYRLSLSGNVRVRQENLWGQYRPGYDAEDQMLAMRSDILAQLKHEGWTLAAMLSDSRAYETGTGSYLTANEVNTLEPVQLSVQRDFKAPFGEGSSATVLLGRFLLNIGSRRLVASDDFRNTPQGSTGVYTDVHFSNHTQWSLFYVQPQQRRPDDFASLLDNEVELDHSGKDQQMWGMLLSRPGLLPGDTLGEILYVGFREEDNGARATRDRDLHSISLRALRAPAARQADFEVEGIYQTGNVSSGTSASASHLDVDAYMLHTAVGYSFDAAWKPRLSLQFDYASGDGTSADYQRFDTLFGMRSADFAPSGIYGMLARTNIQLTGLRLEARPSPRLDFYVTGFWLWAADRHDNFSSSGIGDPSGNSGSYAGYQLDGRARYWIVPQKLRAQLNMTWVQRGELLRDAPNASPHGNPLYGALALTWSF
jgi:hypothetical protein